MALSSKAIAYLRNRENEFVENVILGFGPVHSVKIKHNTEKRGYSFASSVSAEIKDKATCNILKKW